MLPGMGLRAYRGPGVLAVKGSAAYLRDAHRRLRDRGGACGWMKSHTTPYCRICSAIGAPSGARFLHPL